MQAIVTTLLTATALVITTVPILGQDPQPLGCLVYAGCVYTDRDWCRLLLPDDTDDADLDAGEAKVPEVWGDRHAWPLPEAAVDEFARLVSEAYEFGWKYQRADGSGDDVPPTGDVSDVVDGGTQSYPDKGFTIAFPDEWLVVEFDDPPKPGHLLFADDGSGYVSCLMYESWPWLDGSPLGPAEDAPDRLAEHMRDTAEASGANASVAIVDLPAGRVVRVDAVDDDLSVDGYNYNTAFTYFRESGWAIVLSCMSRLDQTDDWLPIAESFEFLPREAG